MAETFEFVSRVEELHSWMGFPPPFEPIKMGSDEIKNFPQLFSASRAFFAKNIWFMPSPARFLVWQAISEFDPFGESVIDTRVHMLMEGQYPCIPGWHCDEVDRGLDGQPDLLNTSEKEHMVIVVDSGTGSLTEFVQSDVTVTLDKDTKVWQSVNDTINLAPRGDGPENLPVMTVKSGIPYVLNQFAIHRGMPAKSQGWRLFIRATKNSRRPILNEEQTISRVYIPIGNEAW